MLRKASATAGRLGGVTCEAALRAGQLAGRSRPACLRSGSAMSAESWCRARRRPRFPPPGVLTRIKHSSWREALQGWVAPALRAARATGASLGRARRRLRGGSSAVPAATTMARCTASGVPRPDLSRAGTRRVTGTKPRLRLCFPSSSTRQWPCVASRMISAMRLTYDERAGAAYLRLHEDGEHVETVSSQPFRPPGADCGR
jgi:hypothetical protein